MKKLLLLPAILAMMSGLLLANFSTPALATPTNTVFDRTISGCDFEFMYGNIFSVPFVKFRFINGSPSGEECSLNWENVYWTKNGSYYGDGISGPWTVSGNWHQFNGTAGGTAYGADYDISVWHYDVGRTWEDEWILSARFNDGDPEGFWTCHNAYPYCEGYGS